jgi:hypothetical protein
MPGLDERIADTDTRYLAIFSFGATPVKHSPQSAKFLVLEKKPAPVD